MLRNGSSDGGNAIPFIHSTGLLGFHSTQFFLLAFHFKKLKCNSSNESTADLHYKSNPHVGSVLIQKFRKDRDLTKLNSISFQFSGEKTLTITLLATGLLQKVCSYDEYFRMHKFRPTQNSSFNLVKCSLGERYSVIQKLTRVAYFT